MSFPLLRERWWKILNNLSSIDFCWQQQRQNKVRRCNLSKYLGVWRGRYVGRLSVVLSRGPFVETVVVDEAAVVVVVDVVVVVVVVRNDFEQSSLAEKMMPRRTSSMTNGRDHCHYKSPPRAGQCCCHRNRIGIAVRP